MTSSNPNLSTPPVNHVLVDSRSIEVFTNRPINEAKAIKYLADLITYEIETTGLSEKELAWLMNKISQGTVNKISKGKFCSLPDYKTLNGMATYFGKSYSDFFRQIEIHSEEEGEDRIKGESEALEKFVLASLYRIESDYVLTEIVATAATMLRSNLVKREGYK